MFNARNQVRWFEEEWRRNNEHEVERIGHPVSEPVVANVSEPVVASVSEPVVASVSEPVVANEEKVAENLAKHVANLKKYFAGTAESTTMPIPVHRQKATR
jgi:hypothetical protein